MQILLDGVRRVDEAKADEVCVAGERCVQAHCAQVLKGDWVLEDVVHDHRQDILEGFARVDSAGTGREDGSVSLSALQKFDR